LISQGYKRKFSGNPGTFSMRGGIIDVFPFTEDHPVRIELFDDEIESIRFFKPDTQRSLDETSNIDFPPARELPAVQDLIISAGKSWNRNCPGSSLLQRNAKKEPKRKYFLLFRPNDPGYLDRKVWNNF
jgi:transcription-repair coupling factor (superfamily II helicase)